MAHEELESLLILLSKYGCSRFKKAGLEIEFGSDSPKSVSAPSPATTNTLQEVPIDEKTLPPDLRADDSMSVDKILLWSGTPDHEAPMPLTGEQ